MLKTSRWWFAPSIEKLKRWGPPQKSMSPKFHTEQFQTDFEHVSHCYTESVSLASLHHGKLRWGWEERRVRADELLAKLRDAKANMWELHWNSNDVTWPYTSLWYKNDVKYETGIQTCGLMGLSCSVIWSMYFGLVASRRYRYSRLSKTCIDLLRLMYLFVCIARFAVETKIYWS